MADIFHNFPIEAPPDKVFGAISSSEGLDKWWTKDSAVNPVSGGIYTLERIAHDSLDDYWTVMETLTTFVRERAKWKGPSSPLA